MKFNWFKGFISGKIKYVTDEEESMRYYNLQYNSNNILLKARCNRHTIESMIEEIHEHELYKETHDIDILCMLLKDRAIEYERINLINISL